MKTRILNWFLWALGTGVILMSPGCTHPAAPAQVVKVPVPVACEIEQVPASDLPPVNAANVFTLSASALAQLRTVQAENVRLRAANANPCPA